MHGSTLLLAAVELASWAGVIAASVFVLVFAIVCLAAWWLIRMLPSQPRGPSSADFSFTRQVSLSGPAAERIASIVERASRRPDITPETRERLEALRETRDTVASVYRRALTLFGLAGVAAAAALFWQADSANMLGLPAAIVLLLGLGALLKGLFPGPRTQAARLPSLA